MNIILSLLLGVVFIKNIYKFSIGGGAIVNYRIFMIISLLAFTCWLVLKAMYSSKIFRGIETKLQFVSSQKLKMKYENIEKKIDYLKKYMAMEEPFLNSEITIKELSNKLKLREQELSILINRYLDKNFYDFINDYRVNKAKEILKDPLNKKLTILEVLYQVGFNSKSSFNTIFKKQTGFTPTQFRKKQFE
ncbi:MAG: AraC family transcriptional regulator [Cellulophaga sp.]